MKFDKLIRVNYRFFIATLVATTAWMGFAYHTMKTNMNTSDELIALDTSRNLNQYSLTLGDIFSKIEVIETFVTTSGIDSITEDSFEDFAEGQSFEGIGFVSFSIAPDGVIGYYYTDIDAFDDQSIVGLDLINDERDHVREAVQYAIENKVVVVNGPFDLLVGDEGIVFRKPVFIDDDFAGIINLVVHVDELYAQLNYFATERIDTAVYDINENLVFGEENFEHNIHAEEPIDLDYVNWHIGVNISKEYQQNNTLFLYFLGSGFTGLYLIVMFLWAFYYFRNRSLINKQRRLIYFDGLTELPNRMQFEEETKQLIWNRTPFFLGFGDLDNFKNINDVLGHSVGDQYLSFIASHLKSLIRENLRVYRWGGDEFIFVFIKTNKNELHKIMEGVFDIFKQPFEVKETKHQISISIGVVEYPKDGSDLEVLVKEADIVMYDIKSQHKNTYSFFEQKYLDRLTSQLDFQQTLDGYDVENFDVYLQPIVDVKAGEVKGFEGLARLFDENGRQFPTQEIIKVYEQDGTITKLDKYVFHKICQYISSCNRVDEEGFFFTFNISPLSLTSEYIDYLERTVHSYNINPKNIVIELIETLGFKDVRISIELLERIKRIGFNVAMDDFGMGYSSLSYITKLPLDLIKIDRSFIHNYENNTFNRTILHTIKDISNSLKLDILVEGIETQNQLDYITKLGAQYYQGYLHSKPMSFEDMKKLLDNEKK